MFVFTYQVYKCCIDLRLLMIFMIFFPLFLLGRIYMLQPTLINFTNMFQFSFNFMFYWVVELF